MTVPIGATVLTELQLHGMTHTYIGDVQFVLQDPAGTNYNIFCRPAFGCDYSGDYTIIGSCNGGMSIPATCATTLAPGTYEQFFGTWPSGTNSINNTALYSIPAAAGTWTLYIYDWAAADIGTLTSWDLCFGTAPAAPVPGLPTLLTPTNGAGATNPVNLTWSTANCATGYDIEVDGVVTSGLVATNFSYSGAVGSHSWRVRGENGSGPGPWTTAWTFNLPPPPPVCTELATIYTAGNGGSLGGQVFFDLNVTNPAGINLGQIAVNTGEAGGFTLDVYTKATTYVGFTANLGAWTLLTSGPGVGAGGNLPSLADVTDVVIPQGTYGVALVLSSTHGFDYTNGTGANQVYTNADLTMTCGAANNVAWTGTPFTPRVFNGTLRYNCVPPGPVTYCTAGTSTHGCVPAISATSQPSATLANACVINIANVEGGKFGIVFYGINQTGFTPTPWAVGSNSFLCVKGPTQRTGSSNAGGTVNLCDGALSLDWNAFQAANPLSVGNPFSSGNKVYVQGWYRDPPAPKTTNLSDALTMTMNP